MAIISVSFILWSLSVPSHLQPSMDASSWVEIIEVPGPLILHVRQRMYTPRLNAYEVDAVLLNLSTDTVSVPPCGSQEVPWFVLDKLVDEDWKPAYGLICQSIGLPSTEVEPGGIYTFVAPVGAEEELTNWYIKSIPSTYRMRMLIQRPGERPEFISSNSFELLNPQDPADHTEKG